MNKSKLSPYRLPISIFIFFISFALLTRTPLFYIPYYTSVLIGGLFPGYDIVSEVEQIALIYAIALSVIAHFFWGKLMQVDVQINKKSLLRNLLFVSLIAIAYIYSRVQT